MSHARAQQPLQLPTVTVEEHGKSADVTNSRLKIGSKPEKKSISPSNSGNAGTAGGTAPASTTNETTSTVGDNATGSGQPVPGGGGIAGASTSIITRDQIARAPQSSLAAIIASEAGVQTSSLYGGPAGAGTTVDLRGFGITGPSNTLVLINGRRLNDWDLPGFDLSTIAKDSVERIEITRGNSGAVLYGDGAVGGVINIVTRTGVGAGNQGRVEGGFGSFATREGNVYASGSSGAFSGSVNANALRSNGYRDNNELEQSSFVSDFRWTIGRGSVFLNLAADEQKLGLPGARKVVPGGINEVRNDPRGATTPLDYAEKQGIRGTVGFTYLLGPSLELIVDGGLRTKVQKAAFFSEFQENYVDTDLRTASLTPRLNMTQAFFGLPSRIITGIDFYDTDYQSNRSMFKGLTPFNIYKGGQQTLAGYWQQTVSVLPTTDLSAGARLQQNTTKLGNTFDVAAPGGASCFFAHCFPNGVDGTPLNQTESNHAWHLGLEHKLVPGVTLIARTAQSFRVANVDERIGSAPFLVAPDFNLRTQQSNDWEAGARLSYGSFNVQSSYYDMQLTNELHFDPVTFINTNLDPTRRRGVETIASWQLFNTLRLKGNLTYTDATFREGPNAGNSVPVVSRWTGNVGLSWNIVGKALTLDTVLHYVGDRRMDNDEANFQPFIPAYTTVDLRLGGEVDKFFWSAGVQNLFDVSYFDYAAASATTLGRYNAYTQPGRNIMVRAGTTW